MAEANTGITNIGHLVLVWQGNEYENMSLAEIPPYAPEDTLHQGNSKDEEFCKAHKIRIHAELQHFCDGLRSRERTLLARRIREDVLENGVDLAQVVPGVFGEQQVQV